MPSYKFFKEPIFNTDSVIRKTNDDGTFIWIPISEENTDYLECQEWVAEGNTIEASDWWQ